MEYDTQTKDAFYFGYINVTSILYFSISRRSKEGNEIWIQQFTNLPIPRSLMYSQENEAIYFSLSVHSNFTLIKINSTSGEYLQRVYGGDFYQHFQYHSCVLSSDESIIF